MIVSNGRLIDHLKNYHDNSPIMVRSADGQWHRIVWVSEIREEVSGRYCTTIILEDPDNPNSP